MKRSLPMTVKVWGIVIALCAARPEANPSARVEYPLTPKCGPWMVMVKSFQGPEAVEIANKLAKELREKHKIPAYTFVRQPVQQPVQEVGLVRGRTRQYVTAAVLAGDCANERAAAKLQDKIQKIRPDCITQEMVPRYQWQAGPLRTAFCLPNPLAPAEPAKPDPLLSRLNSGKNSVYNCSGEYTLQAIVFPGGVAYTREQEKQLEKSRMLEAAGERSEMICDELRKKGFDAYTYHGLNFSLVTVGSFSSPHDPQIDLIRQQIARMRIGAFELSANPQVVQVPRRQ